MRWQCKLVASVLTPAPDPETILKADGTVVFAPTAHTADILAHEGGRHRADGLSEP